MNHRQNMLAAVRFQRPDYIPLSFNFTAASWRENDPSALQDLMEAHPLLFPGFRRSDKPWRKAPPWQQPGRPWTDSWGCVWEAAEYGQTGSVVRHALADWSALESLVPPDPDSQMGWGPIDWQAVTDSFARARAAGRLRIGSLRHGHTFLTLTFLRGYESLMYDMADGEARLDRLIAMVEQFNLGLVRRYLDLGAEWMNYPEDLGMQRGPMLSPDHFRRWIKPVYRRLIAPARQAGCVIHMHSDGDVRDLAADLLDCGLDALNVQDLVNGIDWLAGNLKGRVCIDLDIDRQRITRFGGPAEIDGHIRTTVEKLGSREGGLILRYGCYGGIPLANIRAVMDAMERYAALHA